ncbi:hypothetical protein MPER_13555, partial [Moniliophthora perniciosa FA553]
RHYQAFYPTTDVILFRLSNLFNAIPRTSPLRLTVYRTLLDTAASNEEIDFLNLSRVDVDKWLGEWDISPEEKSA